MSLRNPPNASGQNHVLPKFWLLATLFWAALIACLSLFPGPPQIPGLLGWDKLQHAGAYGFLSLLIAQTLCTLLSMEPDKAWWRAALAALCYGGLMEILQFFMQAGRTAEWWDLAADTLGVFICCVLFRQVASIKSRRHRTVGKTHG